MDANFLRKVEKVRQRDNRYAADAYEFVMQALWFTQKKSKRNGHISGKQLLEGIKKFAIQQYGPMARVVFRHWGITVTNDFGEIVFNMIEAGLMSRSEQDNRSDFDNVYDFDTALDVFRVSSRKGRRAKLVEDEKENLLS